jgi:indole-3-glycerol phosphate synthase
VNELERIVAATKEAVAQRKANVTADRLERLASERPAGERRSLRAALAGRGMSLIAEHKRRSPSAGMIRADLGLAEVVGAYERGGAAAVSILTESPSFGGSLEDLQAARSAIGLPLLRKDFIVDPYQLVESVAAGADAILLIVAALGAGALRALYEEALARGLEALVEVHDERELEAALSLGAPVIGINSRDLTTLQVDTRRVFELLPRLPADRLAVAESGFSRRDELDELADAGAGGVLIGEALMRSPDIEQACRALTQPAGTNLRARI